VVRIFGFEYCGDQILRLLRVGAAQGGGCGKERVGKGIQVTIGLRISIGILLLFGMLALRSRLGVEQASAAVCGDG
jgi:hypothetical protein